MVASRDYGPALVSPTAARGENGVHVSPILDRVRICGCVEREAQAPLLEANDRRVVGDLESPPSSFGLAAPIGSIVRDLLLQSAEEAWWRRLLVLRIPPVGKIVDWH